MNLAILEFALSASPPPVPPSLQSDAFNSDQFESIFQPIIANILGIPANPSPWGSEETPEAWSGVRCAWQTVGQPAWRVNEDVCVLSAYTLNEEFSQIRDEVLIENEALNNLTSQQSYTQVWRLHFFFNGPNCQAHANAVISGMAQGWVHDALANEQIYLVHRYERPVYKPENFDGQWWRVTELDLFFNELVIETIPTESAAGVDVTIETNTGQTDEFMIQVPGSQ